MVLSLFTNKEQEMKKACKNSLQALDFHMAIKAV